LPTSYLQGDANASDSGSGEPGRSRRRVFRQPARGR
jgi:hypothetical protein